MANCSCNIKIFDPVISKINIDCDKTWDMICSGNTLGCFQLESYLGQKLASQCKPRNIEQLAELISVMRPGCLEATLEDGNTVAYHYISRKNGKEEVTYDTPELEPILKDTYGLLLYQEQAMRIATDIAGFSMVKADTLRKSIGKKNVTIMAELKGEFIDVASKNIGAEKAELIFSGIEKSQRYSFNKSHAVGYAQNCYISAYTKYHYPKEFFISYLNSIKKISETAQLINNARTMGVDVRPPDLRKKNAQFEIIDDKIYFGLAHIKGLSEAKLEIITSKPIPKTWEEFLLTSSLTTDSTTIEGLIRSGAIDFYEYPREFMMYQFSNFKELGKMTIIKHIQGRKPKPLTKILKDIIVEHDSGTKLIPNKNSRKKIEDIINQLENPPYILKDNNTVVGRHEIDLLGTPFSRTELDDCPIDITNMTCEEYLNGKNGINGVIIMPMNIKTVKEIKIKKGTNAGNLMCFVCGFDENAEVDGIVVFTDAYEEYKHLLFVGNTVIVKGEKKKGGLIVNKIWQI